MTTKEFPFDKVNEKLDELFSPLEKVFAYKDLSIRESFREENLPIAVLASEAMFNGLVEAGSFHTSSKGREIVKGFFGDGMSDIEFLKKDIMSKIFQPTHIVKYNDFFSKAVSLFRNLPIFKEEKVKELAEVEIGIRYSTFLFVITVFILDNLLSLELISIK
ncbi:MAG: hypothetical protein QME07_02610 [bacterium]|nr:hypothetical protein [bacterium]